MPRAKIFMLWAASGCFLTGLVLAVANPFPPRTPVDPKRAKPVDAQAAEQPELDLTMPATEDLVAMGLSMQEADRLLLSGQSASALRVCRALLAAQPRPTPELRFRIALCGELLGDVEHPLQEYRALAHLADKPSLALAAKLRQIHLLLQLSKPELAKQLLWRDLIAPASALIRLEENRGEIAHSLALVLAAESVRDMHKPLLDDEGITWPALRFSLDQTFDLLEREPVREREGPADTDRFVAHQEAGDGKPAEEPKPRAAVVIEQRFGLLPDETIVGVNLPRMPLAAALDLLARQTGQQILWSSMAREVASEHAVQVQWDAVRLATVLDGLLDPLDLAWQYDEGTLRLFAYEELSEPAARQLRMSTAERAIQHAIVAYPDHALVDEAYWSLGNLAFVRGELDVAQIQYHQYLRQFPRVRGSVRVHFNLAKTHLLLNRHQDALHAFYYVVDSGPEDSAVPSAYLYVGRLYLEDDEARRAIKPLVRAVALARDQDQRAVAVLTLASAYLLEGKPHAANRALMDHREALRNSSHSDQGAFLAALARSRAAKFDTQSEHEARALVAALSHVRPDQFFGGQGHVLIAEAYRTLQLLEPLNETLTAGIGKTAMGKLRDRMLFALAHDYHGPQGNVAQAMAIYQSLATGSVEPWRSRSDLRLAELAIASRKPAMALASCHRLLMREDTAIPREEVLRVLGRVYESQGEHDKAALCYAGVAPEMPRPPPDAVDRFDRPPLNRLPPDHGNND